MGLNIEVGIIADLLENDEEGAEHFRGDFAMLSRYLASIHLKAHIDPDKVDVWSSDMYGYSGLHYLRRIAAHLHYTRSLPAPGDQNAAKDPNLVRYYSDFDKSDPTKAFGAFDHLIVHSDAEGFYIPQDFARVLIPGDAYPIPGGIVGSSQRLREECRKIAAALLLPLDLDPEDEQVFQAADSQGSGDITWKRYGIESYSCLRLYHAANHSIATGAAVVFT
ncbi:MAG TPA: hypothetical protein VL527_04280 [Dongiaceae bacterium]|nr:hypothetical protein [Dongiaceae bacterium]